MTRRERQALDHSKDRQLEFRMSRLSPLTPALFSAAIAFVCATPADAYTAYITSEKDNSISVIDTDKLEVIKTVKVGQRPRGIVMSNDGKWLIVCTSDDNDVKVYDAKTLEYVKSLPSGPDPELLTLHPDGKRLYIANEDDNLVTVVDIDTSKVITEIPVGVEPEGMGMSPDGKVLVNTSETTNMAHFIDTTTHKLFDNVLVDSRPRVAMFNSAQTQLWVSSEVGGTVAVINPADRKVISKINFAIPGVEQESIQPVGIRITKDDKIAFVALGPANRVAVVDTATFKVLKYILVGQRVWQMFFTPDGKLLFTTNGASNDVSVIDVASQKAIKSIKVGRYPWGVVVSPK
jgi:PQQ-dependent catabolism-associated beta-propeller protein